LYFENIIISESAHFYTASNSNTISTFVLEKRYVTQTPPIQCSSTYNLTSESPSVMVTSPGYPSNYPSLSSCHVILVAPIGKQIFLDFLHMNIEAGKK